MNIAVLGAGAYALGLTYRFSKNKDNKITVWSAVSEEIQTLKKTNRNEKALSNVVMPDKIIYTTDIKEALSNANIIVIAVATKFVRSVCETIKKYAKNKHIIIASKGIEQNTCLFASNIVKDVLKTKKLGTISGPSFAKDMVSNDLIGLSLATTNNKTKQLVVNAFLNSNIKLRVTNDFIGVELCGTLKNVIAVTSGILDGMNVSESTKAMFLTESLNDARHLIKKLKGNEKTIMSYAGFGDILLTCTSISSRNYSYGKLIGENKSKEELNNYLKSYTVEGVYTLESIYGLLKKRRVKMPFINLVYDIVINSNHENIIKFLKEKE